MVVASLFLMSLLGVMPAVIDKKRIGSIAYYDQSNDGLLKNDTEAPPGFAGRMQSLEQRASEFEQGRSWCLDLIAKHYIIPQGSWGTLASRVDRQRYSDMHCDFARDKDFKGIDIKKSINKASAKAWQKRKRAIDTAALRTQSLPICARSRRFFIYGVTGRACPPEKQWLDMLDADNRTRLVYLNYRESCNLSATRGGRLRLVHNPMGTWTENRNILYLAMLERELIQKCLFLYHVFADSDVILTVRSPFTLLHDIVLNTLPLTWLPFYSNGWHPSLPKNINTNQLRILNDHDPMFVGYSPRGRQFLLPYEEELEEIGIVNSAMMHFRLQSIIFWNTAAEILAVPARNPEHSQYKSDCGGAWVKYELIDSYLARHNVRCQLPDDFPLCGANRHKYNSNREMIASDNPDLYHRANRTIPFYFLAHGLTETNAACFRITTGTSKSL